MGRSLIGENQVVGHDFLSEDEFAVASGVINDKIHGYWNSLQYNIATLSGTVSGIATLPTTTVVPTDGDILVYSTSSGAYEPKKISTYIDTTTLEMSIAMSVTLG